MWRLQHGYIILLLSGLLCEEGLVALPFYIDCACMIEFLFAIAMVAQEGQILGNQEDFVKGWPAFKPWKWKLLQTTI